jgi:hypothetical protein
LDALKALYDGCSLAVVGYSALFMQRENAFLTNDAGIWRAVAEYRIVLEKS